MSSVAFPIPVQRTSLLRPILVGGAIAGTLDLICALLTFGPNGMRGVAAGLIGRQAFSGGIPTLILGTLLHYFIAFSIATVYCLASRRLRFLRDHFFVCGLFYGIGAYLVMNLVVLPLCALHFSGPYQWRGLVQGLLIHMFFIGLPISYSLRKLSS
jgi:hypothetical protein